MKATQTLKILTILILAYWVIGIQWALYMVGRMQGEDSEKPKRKRTIESRKDAIGIFIVGVIYWLPILVLITHKAIEHRRKKEKKKPISLKQIIKVVVSVIIIGLVFSTVFLAVWDFTSMVVLATVSSDVARGFLVTLISRSRIHAPLALLGVFIFWIGVPYLIASGVLYVMLSVFQVFPVFPKVEAKKKTGKKKKSKRKRNE